MNIEFREFDETNANTQAEDGFDSRDIALRDVFVSEYLVDYDHVAAAMRCGFNFELAQKWAGKFMREAYVQQQIQRLQLSRNDPESEEAFQKQWILQRLRQEASYKGPGSSHGARVAALNKLSAFYAMDKSKDANPGQLAGGVVELPATANGEDWEKAAIGSQQALMQDAAN